MFSSLFLGRAFGIRLYLHWSFWLMPLFVFFATFAEQGTAEAVLMVAVLLTLFACVMLHELGHALMARQFGVGTQDITLYPIGGVARLKRMSERPIEEFWIAVAGPMVNVAIAVGLALGMYFVGLPLKPRLETTPLIENFLNRLLWMNVGLVLFNLLPAFPMDGGRVLRAILAMGISRVQATRIAVAVGTGLAILFVLGGLLWVGNPFLAVVGVLIVTLGQQELSMVKQKARSAASRDANHPDAPFIIQPEQVRLANEGPTPPSPGYSGVTFDSANWAWVEWRDGEPVRIMPMARFD